MPQDWREGLMPPLDDLGMPEVPPEPTYEGEFPPRTWYEEPVPPSVPGPIDGTEDEGLPVGVVEHEPPEGAPMGGPDAVSGPGGGPVDAWGAPVDATQAEPQPDAVSGADPPYYSDEERAQHAARVQSGDAALRGMIAEGGPEEASRADYNYWASMTPDQFAYESAKLEQERAQVGRDAAAKLQASDDEAFARNEKFRVDMAEAASAYRAQLEADLEKLGATKIDQNRWMHSGGRTAAALIGAAIGGLLNPGGKNSTIDLMQSQIDQDIRIQQADLDNQRAGLTQKRGLLADFVAQSGNVYEAAERARAVYWENGARAIQEQMAQYDPNGTTFRDAVGQVNAMKAKSAAAAQKAELEMHKQWREDIKVAEDQRQALEREEHSRRELHEKKLSRHQTARDKALDRQAAAERRAEDKAEKEKTYRRTHGVGGVKVIAADGSAVPYTFSGNPSQVDKLADIVAGRNIMQEAIGHAAELREEGGVEWWDNVQEAHKQHIVRAFAAVYGMQQTTADEVASAKKAAGEHFRGVKNPVEALEQLSDSVDIWATEQLKARASDDVREASGGKPLRLKFDEYGTKRTDKGAPETALEPVVPKGSTTREEVRKDLADRLSKESKGRYSAAQIRKARFGVDPLNNWGKWGFDSLSDVMGVRERWKKLYSDQTDKTIDRLMGGALSPAERKRAGEIHQLRLDLAELKGEGNWSGGDVEEIKEKQRKLEKLRKLQLKDKIERVGRRHRRKKRKAKPKKKSAGYGKVAPGDELSDEDAARMGPPWNDAADDPDGARLRGRHGLDDAPRDNWVEQ